MKGKLFNTSSVRGLLLSLAITIGFVLVLSILYFYIYLPSVTNHGESITVPDLTGMEVDELDSFLTKHELRFAVNDSAYSSEYPPLAVLRQFPQAGSR